MRRVMLFDDPDKNSELINEIRVALTKRRISLKQAQAEIGVASSTLTAFLAGKNAMNHKSFMVLLSLCGIDLIKILRNGTESFETAVSKEAIEYDSIRRSLNPVSAKALHKSVRVWSSVGAKQ